MDKAKDKVDLENRYNRGLFALLKAVFTIKMYTFKYLNIQVHLNGVNLDMTLIPL